VRRRLGARQPRTPMFCSHCGTEASSDDQFCKNCGRSLSQPTASPDPRMRSRCSTASASTSWPTSSNRPDSSPTASPPTPTSPSPSACWTTSSAGCGAFQHPDPVECRIHLGSDEPEQCPLRAHVAGLRHAARLRRTLPHLPLPRLHEVAESLTLGSAGARTLAARARGQV